MQKEEKSLKVIELNNVAVIYKERKSLFKSNEFRALKDISFDVYKGEVLGIIGRNGAGKSTLLRLLAGIIKPDAGYVNHNTDSVSLMALAAGFDSNLSGRQNSIISGMLMGYSKKYIQTKLEEIKNFSELQEFFEKPVKTYSSGMRARLAFSIAMYVSPDVLLIDEVLGVGDVSFKQKAELALEEKIASNITVIIVSHSEQQVSRLAERVIWIDDGKVYKEGLPQEIFPEYNVNIKFSTFGLKVEEYKVSDDFIFNFESLKVENDILNFNCIFIDKGNNTIEGIQSRNDKNYIISKMEGPTKTPAYHNKFPELIGSSQARFHKGKIQIGELSYLDVIEENNQVICQVKVSKVS
ncbi:ABC transporter ATP-binding protein [uncultured Vibrio sp.]|uniref:ABC transporter ATP-binding protein n=1 Tax=uncultured Vibrio sp. TaxID=114054 RepID=UPI00261ADEF4|nr:ABC transporter ATP-binding protein [uncultured Vibrio sp.]